MLVLLITKAQYFHSQDNYSEAIKYYDKALEINPNYLVTLSNKGVDFLYQDDYSEAIKYFDKALEINPNDLYVCYER